MSIIYSPVFPISLLAKKINSAITDIKHARTFRLSIRVTEKREQTFYFCYSAAYKKESDIVHFYTDLVTNGTMMSLDTLYALLNTWGDNVTSIKYTDYSISGVCDDDFISIDMLPEK